MTKQEDHLDDIVLFLNDNPTPTQIRDYFAELLTKHQEDIENSVEKERDRIRTFVLKETTVTLDSGVGIVKPEYQFGQKIIQALTPTKTDKTIKP